MGKEIKSSSGKYYRVKNQLSNLGMLQNHLEAQVKADCWPSQGGLGWYSRICISHECPGDVGVEVRRTTGLQDGFLSPTFPEE